MNNPSSSAFNIKSFENICQLQQERIISNEEVKFKSKWLSDWLSQVRKVCSLVGISFNFLPANKLLNPPAANTNVSKLDNTDANERSLQASPKSRLKTHSYHCIISARMAALPLTANTIKAGISGAPRPARERPLGTALVLVDLSLSWAFQDKCYYPASPQQTTSAAATSVLPTSVRSSALKQNMRENLFDLRENDHFFFLNVFLFWNGSTGWGGCTGLNVPAGRSEKWHNWRRDFIVTCARSLWTWGDVGRAAGAAQCRATCGLPGDRPVTGHFLWFTTKQVAPHWLHYSCSSVQPWWITD